MNKSEGGGIGRRPMKNLSKKLSKVYGTHVRIRGPYLCEDGRKRVDVVTSNYTRTHQLARVKLEVKLGRKLKRYETVDHKDEDKTNNRYANLQVLTLKANAFKSVTKLVPIQVKCAWCSKTFVLRKNQRETRANAKAGPFCSRSCTGRYGASVQNCGPVLKRKSVKRIYYQ